MAHTVAVVEDDPEMGDYFLQLLRQKGYSAALYPTAGRFFDALLKKRPDAALIDMQLPGMDGKEIIRVLRNSPQGREMILIAVSGEQKAVSDVVAGLKSGADEYFTKPVDPELLCVRLEGFLRRTAAQTVVPEEVLEYGELALYMDQRVCKLKGRAVELTRLEFDLLAYFLRQSDRVLTRSLLLEQVWEGDPVMTTRTVDKHVENLRRKLGAFGARIEAVIRVGYILRK
ncbi:MAG: response regulator transcription factor [Elusimicrobiota bacterium]|jgi:DNA-binding response OmpR family regulator